MSEQFKPFERVLVRDGNNDKWCVGLYSHPNGLEHIVAGGTFLQCIPYEGNEHLVGTDKSREEPETFAFGEHVEVRDQNNQSWFKAIYLWENQNLKGFHRCALEYEVSDWAQCRKADW